MQVRPATRADVPEIVRLKALIMTTSYPFSVDVDAHPDWPARAATAVEELLDHPDYTVLVIDGEPGRLAGCVSAAITHHVPGPEWGARHAYLADMCTDLPHRGSGLGRLLMDAALDWCRAHGAHTVALDATPSAMPIYERLGFQYRTDELFPTMRRWL